MSGTRAEWNLAPGGQGFIGVPALDRRNDRRSTPRGAAVTAASLLLLLSLLPGRASPVFAQAARPIPSGEPVDTTGLGRGPRARMHMLLEKTLFKVDVLTLDVRLGVDATRRVEALLDGNRSDGGAVSRDRLRDSLAAVALGTHDAWALIEFQRNVSLDQFLGGVRDNLREATRAGVIQPATFHSISDALPRWYAFLADRGIRTGDEMHYRIRGDSLHTVYVGADGAVLLDQVDVGPERRQSVLGGYFAPGTDFREKLIDSLASGG